MSEKPAAVILGAGQGLGLALVKLFSKQGLWVLAAAREANRLEELLAKEPIADAHAHACDAGDQDSVKRLFERLGDRPLEIAVYNAGGYARGSILDLSGEAVERALRIGALGAFYFGQAAARAMIARGRGTIVFTGATAALRGSSGFAAFAMSKFAARALAQSMARELGPKGIHVAHVNIDGQIGPGEGGSKLHPDSIAQTYWSIHVQDRSAWSQEVDLRPWAEKF
jgi:NAD(P)-dependent dehydrogenase (short-subunit alcohol dehydrogenase family)